VLVVDNASYHRTRQILHVLEYHGDHAFIFRLPRYSPELNLIEGLWEYLKRSAMNNYFFGDTASLEHAIQGTFAVLQRHPETTLSPTYCTATNL